MHPAQIVVRIRRGEPVQVRPADRHEQQRVRMLGDLFQQAKAEQNLYQVPDLAPQEAQASQVLAQKIRTSYVTTKPRVLRAALITLLQSMEAATERETVNE